MTIIEWIELFFIVLGILGIIIIVELPFVFLFHKLKVWRLRRKIPDKVKKEVENERLKRQSIKDENKIKYNNIAREEASRGDTNIERDFELPPSSRVDTQPAVDESMAIPRDYKVKRRHQSNRFNPI